MTPADGLSDSLIKRVKGRPGMNERVEAVVLAYEDAAIKPVVDSIAGFEHRAPARKRAVDANKLQLGAEVAWG